MKTIVLSLEDLKERIQTLNSIRSQYEDIAMRLHQVIENGQYAYQKNGQPLFTQDLDLSLNLQQLSEKIGVLANLLELQVEEIKHENNQ